MSLGSNCHFKLTILNFGAKLPPKRIFQIWKRKTENHHWILHIRFSVGSKFQLQQTILIFWKKIHLQKRILLVEKGQRKWISSFLHIRISLRTKFQFKLTILIFGLQLPKKDNSSLKRIKNKHHHWTVHIQKGYFAQKGYFLWKTENQKTPIDFCLFELVKVPNFSLNWQC